MVSPKPVPSLLASSLEEAMAGLRVETMNLFVSELMLALGKAGFTFDELLDGLAEYSDSRPDWQAVTKHLEDAGREVFQVRQELTGGSKKWASNNQTLKTSPHCRNTAKPPRQTAVGLR